jgi:hypothetical protein
MSANSLIPPDDREFILRTLQESERRQTKRSQMIYEKIGLLDSRLEHLEGSMMSVGKTNARKIAISSGTLVSVLTAVIGYLVERFL